MTDRLQLSPFTTAFEKPVVKGLQSTFASSEDGIARWLEQAGHEHVFVALLDGRPVGSLLQIPMGLSVGGAVVDTLGVAGVMVVPDARGRGIGRRMMTRWLTQADSATSVLYASTRSLYSKVGYGLAGTRHIARLSTDILRAGPIASGWRPMEPSDAPTLEALHRRFVRTRPGHLHRGPYVWGRVRGSEKSPHDGWIWSPDGEIRGWLLFRHARTDGDWSHLDVKDLVALDPEALHELRRFLGGFSSMARTLEIPCGPRSAFLEGLPEHRYTVELHEPFMLRLLDLQRSLQQRGWPKGLSTAVSFRVEDPIRPSNTGSWSLSVAGGEATLTATADAELDVTPAALAGLFTGYASAEQLALQGTLTGPPEALERITSLFAGPAPGMPDFF